LLVVMSLPAAQAEKQIVSVERATADIETGPSFVVAASPWQDLRDRRTSLTAAG
jgi:hypothetical protein